MFVLSIITFVLLVVAAMVFFTFIRKRKEADIALKDARARAGDDRYANFDREVDDVDSLRFGSFLSGIIAAVLSVLLIIFLFFSSFYAQDAGEAKVLKDWTGNLVGQDVTQGGDFKAPWVDLVDFDIRNQMAAYIGNGQDDYNGQKPNGPQITFQDSAGVTGNLDVVVVYSIKPDAVTEIYKEYQNQENFRTRLIEQDIRSVVRNVPSTYDTIGMLNSREEVGTKIQAALEKRWESKGVLVESVSLQEIRYSDDVKARFDQAQQARTDVETAQANLEKSKVDAQQKIVQAQAEAQANNELTASLSDQVLKQRYLDTLKELAAAGNLVVVPEGFNGLVNVTKQ